jgi:ornithine carbamoyltransferase
MTIYEKFGHMDGLKVAFIGDGNNVATSLLHACAKLGMDFTIASPEGYDLSDKVLADAREMAKVSGISIKTLRDPKEAVSGVDVIYTDTWTSMGQEAETEKRKAVFPPYQVNNALLKLASPNAIVMHCLPAHRGQEITDEVADGPQSALFPQAHNRLHAQKAILVELLA